MSKTKKIRDQHETILAIATEISEHLLISKVVNDANKIISLLATFYGKLNYHLSLEDTALYPKLLASPDKKISDTAKRYIDGNRRP